MIRAALSLMFMPATLMAGEVTVEAPVVPLAPPGAVAHAAYFTLANTGDTPRQLIGVSAEGYMMAHIHRTEVSGDVAMMSSVDALEIPPGQSVVFAHGGLHVMLMRPTAPLEKGGQVELTLEFANGEAIPVSAIVVPFKDLQAHGS
ncbi:MAG: copper chaperone PCu(A)C [Pseudomonadota bacterium]